MDKMGYEKGLIKYTSENALAGKKSRVIRLRTVLYALLLTAISIIWVSLIVNRQMLHADLVKDRNSLYQEIDENMVENVFALRLVNKNIQEGDVILSIEPAEIFIVSETQIHYSAEGVTEMAIRIRAEQDTLTGSMQSFKLVLKDAVTGKEIEEFENNFLSPIK